MSVRVVGVCLVIKRAEPMFNKKVKVLNCYLSVVVNRPRVFVWQHQILDSPSHDFLLEDGVHLRTPASVEQARAGRRGSADLHHIYVA